MLVLRIIAVLAVIAAGTSVLAFLFSRDRRYLNMAWQIIKYSVVIALVILALFFLERVAAF